MPACFHGAAPLPVLGSVFAVVLCWSEPAAAQSTLVVRDASQAHPEIEASLDEVLRAELGSSARRVEISLSDLALAAGCEGAPEAPACIASIAGAAGADLVAVEHLRRDGDGYHVEVLLYSRDGTLLRTLAARCEPGHCHHALASAVRGESDEPATDSAAPTATEEVTGSAPRSGVREASPRLAMEPAGANDLAESPHRDFEIRTSSILYTSAAVTGVIAVATAIVSADAAGTASSLGVVSTQAQADTLVAAEERRDVALGTSVAFGLLGAGLAAAGAALQITESDARLAVIPMAGGGAMVSCGGTF